MGMVVLPLFPIESVTVHVCIPASVERRKFRMTEECVPETKQPLQVEVHLYETDPLAPATSQYRVTVVPAR